VTNLRQTQVRPGSPMIANARFGPLVDTPRCDTHVGFTPKSGHVQCAGPCPL